MQNYRLKIVEKSKYNFMSYSVFPENRVVYNIKYEKYVLDFGGSV
jgi:hypothetical protein